MTDPKPTKLDKLLEKQRQLAEQIAAINAREKSEERKRDTRRKILIGGAVLASYRHGDFSKDQLVALLDTYLEHDRDRALFDFLPSSGDGSTKAATPPVQAKAGSPDLLSGSDGSDEAISPPSTATESRTTYRHDPIARKENLI